MKTLILAGVSGDLASRKLLPALRSLASGGTLPFDRVIGTSRRAVAIDPGSLGERFVVRQCDIGNAADVAALAKDIEGEVVVYLSLPPGTVVQAAYALKHGGLGRARLLLEKPFGFDAQSATAEATELSRYFKEEQLYRVDHFIFKSLADEVSDKASQAKRLEIVASEDSVVGHRANFYETTGALRDFGNHLLSLAAIALGGRETLSNFQLIGATRAQYDMYRDEVANPTSETETFFSLNLVYGNTQVLLASGKGFATKDTRVCVDGAEYHDTNDRAYQEVLLAAARGDREKFLHRTEVLQSWRLLDKARLVWGTLSTYKRGVEIGSLIKR